MDSAAQRTILLAEDEEPIRKLLDMVLRQKGYRLLPASSGREALRLAESYSGDIDMLITNLIMPGMSGKELADELCRARPNIKILYITGYAPDEADNLKKCANPGGHIIQKPFTMEEFSHVVEEIFTAAQARRRD